MKRVALLAAVLAACPAPQHPAPPHRTSRAGGPSITWKRVARLDEVPTVCAGSAATRSESITWCSAGRVNDAVFCRNFLEAVAQSTAHYHPAASVPSDHVVGVKGEEIAITDWQRFSEGDTVELGKGARFTITIAPER